MTIAELREKCKMLLSAVPRDLLILAIIVVASLFAFGLGYLAGLDASRTDTLSVSPSQSIDIEREKRVVASKSGTKYYLAWCGGALRISPENTVWFDTSEDAEAAGYTKADNCAGL